jgi:LemA protein
MKNLWLIVVLVIFALLFFVGCGKYNTFVTKDENVNQTWAKVETAYQSRSDLVPNLVATVKGAADFERGTLTDVIEARSQATSIQLTADELTPENMAKFQEAQSKLSGALSRLLVSVERYPELKATAQFGELQSQLEGIENRIRVERNRFNDSATDYNTTIRTFPNSFIASITGFDRRALFESDPGAQNAPKVEF